MLEFLWNKAQNKSSATVGGGRILVSLNAEWQRLRFLPASFFQPNKNEGYLVRGARRLPKRGRSQIRFNPESNRRVVARMARRTIPQPKSVSELLAVFDGGVEAARNALAAMDDKTLPEKWELRMKDKVLIESTRGATLRQTINHLVHHRAQLGVYLKINGVPHPAVYGASGDEGWA